MDRNKIYEKRARLYPVIISMILPLILLIFITSDLIEKVSQFDKLWNILISIIPATVLTGAISYGVKSLSRSTSKVLFQFPLFKEDETHMPTTEFLLRKNNSLSMQNKKLIREKIKGTLNMDLPSEEEEKSNEQETRLIIADAVKRIREKTRDNLILFNYNCDYGFIRNYMGANVWALIITISIWILNLSHHFISNKIFIISVVYILLTYPISIFILKHKGREYARQLFTAFLEIK